VWSWFGQDRTGVAWSGQTSLLSGLSYSIYLGSQAWSMELYGIYLGSDSGLASSSGVLLAL
jgi:hypothetical protein